jgi:anti-anti-sigma regulatory factor
LGEFFEVVKFEARIKGKAYFFKRKDSTIMSQEAVKETVCAFREAGAGIFTLEVKGALGRHLDPGLFDALNQIRGLSGNAIALDFSEGRSLDGEGLLHLFRCGYLAKQKNIGLAAFGTGDESRKILLRLGLGEVIPLFSTEENALRALGANNAESKAVAGDSHEICVGGEWLKEYGRVRKEELPPGDPGLNVLDRNMQLPVNGYGILWLKRYSIRLCRGGLSTAEAATALRSSLGNFWPEGNKINFRETGMTPGAVGTIRLTMPGGAPLATGVRVVHAGPASFTFAPIQGHMVAGFINFAVFDEDGCPIIRICSLARTGDPVFDAGFRLFGHRQQEQFWKDTLTRAAAAFKVPADVVTFTECVDPHSVSTGWSNTANNAAILTPFGLVASSVRSLFGGKSS